MKFSDRLMPGHPEHAGEAPYFTDIASFLAELDACINQVSGIEEIEGLEIPPGVPLVSMSTHPATLRMIQILLRLQGARRVLEIGSFIGRSAIYLARALPAGGEVVTIERGIDFAVMAQRNCAKLCPEGRSIVVQQGDGYHPDPGEFDAVFIDGGKESYLQHFLDTHRGVSPGGLMLIDDCFFHGDVLNDDPVTEKGAGVKRLMDHVAGLDGWLKLALPIGNGLLIMVRGASAA